MGKKQKYLGAGAFLTMMILILDGKTAVTGAYEGIELCLNTVIPSLFPFFVLSNLITSTLIGTEIPILRPVGKICGIPAGLESLLIPAFLGGYPVGAQTIAQGWRQGSIPKNEAKRLMAFCNNAGPSFLFGMISTLFPSPLAAWILWGIHIFSALTAAWIIPSADVFSERLLPRKASLPEVLRNSINAMGLTCGWILLFRILITFLNRWILWLLPVPVRVAVTGLLELSNGCIALAAVEDFRLRFVIASGILAMGGICVIMQVASSANGLPLSSFFQGKAIQTVLSVLLAVGFVYRKPWIWLIPFTFLMVFQRKPRKNGSIPAKAGV